MSKKITVNIDNIPDKLYDFIWEASTFSAAQSFKTEITPTDTLSINGEYAAIVGEDSLNEAIGLLIGLHIASERFKNRANKTT